MATYKDVKGVGRVTYDKDGGVNTVSTASGSYDDKTGTYKITDLKTGIERNGQGTREDFDKAFSSYGGSGGGSSSRSSSLGSYNITNQLEALKKAQLSASMAALDKQRNSSLSNLSSERTTIEPQYQKAKTQAGVTAKQTARSFDEYMAQRGGSKSGIAGQGTLLNNVAYQRQYGELDQAEKSAIADNARRVTDVNNAYESDVVGAQAGIEAQALQNYINQMNLDRAYNQQNYQFDRNYGLSEAGLTGYLNGQQTMQGATNALQNQGLNLSNDYQSLVNQNYPAQQALAMAQAQASLTGTNLQNDYQKLVNAGYPAREAAELAQAAATLANTQKSTSLMGVSRSSGGSSSTNITAQKYAQEQDSKIATAEAFDVLNNLANQGKTRSEIFKAMKDNYSTFVNGNVNMDELWNMADKAFQWDG